MVPIGPVPIGTVVLTGVVAQIGVVEVVEDSPVVAVLAVVVVPLEVGKPILPSCGISSGCIRWCGRWRRWGGRGGRGRGIWRAGVDGCGEGSRMAE